MSQIIGHRFLVTTCGLLLFNALIRGSQLQNLTSRNWRRACVLWCEVYFDILNHLGLTDECDRQSDGQTY